MLKIAMAQMKIVPGHPDKNAASMLKMISEAKAASNRGSDPVAES